MDDSIEQSASSEDNEVMNSYYKRLLSESDPTEDDDNSWMLTMSDLMSLLLVFFIMFFLVTKKNGGAHNVSQSKMKTSAVYNEALKPVTAKMVDEQAGIDARVRDEITARIRILDLDDDVYVAVNNSGVLITLKEQVSFRPGDGVILPDTGPILDNIAGIIKQYPEFLVEITGHTDNIPINTSQYPSNWELSAARAMSVLKYFIVRHNIDPTRLSIKGNADKKPVAPNDTPGNRAQNRRVEIRLNAGGA